MKTVPRGLVLDTKDAEVTEVEMCLWKRILDTLIDPNIIALMLSLGVLGIVVELYNPGLIFPATLGGICLIIGFYGLQVLPVNWAGVLLMLLAAGFWAAEPFVMSHGALALAGAVSFVFGALLLFDPAGSDYQVSLPVAIGDRRLGRALHGLRRGEGRAGSAATGRRRHIEPRRHAGCRAPRRARGGEGRAMAGAAQRTASRSRPATRSSSRRSRAACSSVVRHADGTPRQRRIPASDPRKGSRCLLP